MPIVSNLIKLSLGSLLVFLIFACTNETKSIKQVSTEIMDTCKYYKSDARKVVSSLSCYTCHVKAEVRVNNMPTFSEISSMDSLKIINFAFIKKHNGWFSNTGVYKSARMDTLNDCEIKSVIRYIKDYNRDTPPMSSQ
ncbi:hypothetical protein [Pedobacter sp. R20-19]|uniref:hypothetical protein n=1 Tax=Pedobacter sp. R20-19 TaxID=1270196 RepID=UPI0012FC82D0|nr:hypothetical protein [Pedobacter sp. R20-19]